MKVLVTGATGFIGNYVIEQLLKVNCEVIATSTSKLKTSEKPWFSKVKFIEYSLDEKISDENLLKFFHEPDLLIHLAWKGLPNYKELYHLNNLLPQYFFIQNLVEHGLKDIVVTGTCFEYGMQNGCLNEGMPPQPITPYSIAKNSLRQLLYMLSLKHHFNFKWVRLFYIYGNGQNPNSLIPLLEKAIKNNDKEFNMSGGEQLRDYLKVEQVAEIICKIALQKKVQGITNCCSGTPVSVREFVEEYLKERNTNLKLNLGYYPYTDYEPMAFWGDNSKLKQALKEYDK